MPRTVDEAEFAVRAVLGQQVSTAAARTHAARLVTAHGEPVDDPEGGLTHLFPSPEALAGARPRDARAAPQPAAPPSPPWSARSPTARSHLGVGSDWDEARAQLTALPGFGPWTVEVDRDARPRRPRRLPRHRPRHPARGRGARACPSTPAALTARAAAWRPWRAYAVQYLWATDDHPINHLPA